MLKDLFASQWDSDVDSNSDSELESDSDLGNSSSSLVSSCESITHESLSGKFEIILHQQKLLGIAHQLWPAATLLCNYLERNLLSLYPDQSIFNILELGAGTGLCGLFLGKAIFTTLQL